MKKILALCVLLSIGLVACAPSEPAADTSGVVNEKDAPPMEGDSAGTPAAKAPADAAEGSSEGG